MIGQVVSGALSRSTCPFTRYGCSLRRSPHTAGQALRWTGELTPADAARLATAGPVQWVPRPSTGGRSVATPSRTRADCPAPRHRSPADPWVRVASRRSRFGPLPVTPIARPQPCARHGCHGGRAGHHHEGGVSGSTRPAPDQGSPYRPARPSSRTRTRRRQLGARPRRPGGRSSPPERSGHARDAHEVPGRRTAAAR